MCILVGITILVSKKKFSLKRKLYNFIGLHRIHVTKEAFSAPKENLKYIGIVRFYCRESQLSSFPPRVHRGCSEDHEVKWHKDVTREKERKSEFGRAMCCIQFVRCIPLS